MKNLLCIHMINQTANAHLGTGKAYLYIHIYTNNYPYVQVIHLTDKEYLSC